MVVAEVWVTSDDLLDVFEFEGMFVALVKGLHNVCHGWVAISVCMQILLSQDCFQVGAK